jgi:hypothetical protein
MIRGWLTRAGAAQTRSARDASLAAYETMQKLEPPRA